MESVLSRYRNLIVLVGVLFLQVLGLAVQVKRSGDADTRLIRIWAVDVITPLERGVVRMQNGASSLWHNYFYLRGVRAENRQLKEQIEQMRLEQVRLSEDAAQAHRLQALLAFKEQFVIKTVAAQVIGSSGSDSSRILYIDKGENDGVARDQAVVTVDGIVGKVLQVFPSVSQVLLINDQSSGVGAILEKSRLQGVLRGTANGEVMLERVMSDEQVEPGEIVRTSGGDQIFPKGLPVGTVAHVGTGKDLFLSIRVRPAANLSKLEEVLVVTEKQERAITANDTVRMRAADILAQRLPSVPDKPAASALANAAGASNTSTSTGSTAVKISPKPGAGVKLQSGGTTASQVSSVVKPGGEVSAAKVAASANTSVSNPSLGSASAKAASSTPGAQAGTRAGQMGNAPRNSAPTTGGASKAATPASAASTVSGSSMTGVEPKAAKPSDSEAKPAANPPQVNPQASPDEDAPH